MTMARASSVAALLALLLGGCVARAQTLYDADGNPVEQQLTFQVNPPAGSASTSAPGSTGTGTATAPADPVQLTPAGGPFAAALGEIAALIDAGLWTDAWLASIRLMRGLYARRDGSGRGEPQPQTRPGRMPRTPPDRDRSLNDTLRNAQDALEEIDR